MLHLWQIRAEDEAEPTPANVVVEPRARRGSARAWAGQREPSDALVLQERAMGILGHELRNPLSAIAALARSMMQRPDLPDEVLGRLEQVDRAAQRSLAMVASVLDFSEIRSHGSLPVRSVLTDPLALTSALVDELRVANPGRTITLDVRGKAVFPMDPVRMGQVLSNLISNALVHGSAHAPVEVSLDVSDHEACFVVINRGRVIPPERVAALFQPFARGIAENDNETGGPRGLGLGLYIVDVIVAAHGGTVTVCSDAATGTAFTVRLPRLPR